MRTRLWDHVDRSMWLKYFQTLANLNLFMFCQISKFNMRWLFAFYMWANSSSKKTCLGKKNVLISPNNLKSKNIHRNDQYVLINILGYLEIEYSGHRTNWTFLIQRSLSDLFEFINESINNFKCEIKQKYYEQIDHFWHCCT